MHCTTVHYNYSALCGGLHEICSTAHFFDLRCESVTSGITKPLSESQISTVRKFSKFYSLHHARNMWHTPRPLN